MDELQAMGCLPRLGEDAAQLVASCDFAVISPAVTLKAPVVTTAKRLGIPVLGELEFAFRHTNGTKLAITGTNGKTTTVTLVSEMLKNAGHNAFVAGNIGVPLSQVALEARPGDTVVIEVSSFQMETADQFHPHGAILTNLTPDHLNRHGTMEAYGALKARMVARQDAHDFLVYNADDAFCCATAEASNARKVPFSRTQKLKAGAYVLDGQVIVCGKALCAVEEIGIPGRITWKMRWLHRPWQRRAACRCPSSAIRCARLQALNTGWSLCARLTVCAGLTTARGRTRRPPCAAWRG